MICDQVFLQVCPLAEDLSEIRTDFKCTEEGCDTHFKSTSNLEMHLIKRHNKESYFLQKKMENVSFQYYCPVPSCKYSLLPEKEPHQLRWFPKLKYLKQHYFKVHKEKTVQCEECGKKFSSEALKNQHKRNQCGRTFSCGSCSLVYNSSGALFMHCKRKGHAIKDDIGPPPKAAKAVGTSPPTEVVRRERRILPKPNPDPSVDIAAAALSELSQKVIVKGVDKGVQTTGRRRVQVKQLKKKSSTETQTDSKQQRISSETQTTGFYSSKGKPRRNRRKSMQTQTRQTPASQGEQLSLPELVDPLGDIVLSELWATRNSSSTQTADAVSSVNLDLLTENDSDSITEEQISRLIQQNTIFDYGRMCDIETQTTVNDDFMDDCPIFLNTETQTIQNAIDEYSHNYTQTCDDILLNDFVEFSDIETQTVWAYLRASEFPLVSAETQTAS